MFYALIIFTFSHFHTIPKNSKPPGLLAHNIIVIMILNVMMIILRLGHPRPYMITTTIVTIVTIFIFIIITIIIIMILTMMMIILLLGHSLTS